MQRLFTYWKQKSALEIFKFSVYLVAPLLSSAVYANPEMMKSIILKFKLIEYPEAAPAPPVGDEIRKYVLQAKKELEEQQKMESVKKDN